MNEEDDIPLEEIENENLLVPSSKWTRWLYAFVGIFLPILSFALTFSGAFDPDWQDGRISSYTKIMLNGTIALCFYPFLAYSILSFSSLLIAPKRFSKYFLVRLGIYTGVVLSLEYAILLGFSTDGLIYMILGGDILLFFLIRWFDKKVSRKTLFITLAVLFLLGLIATSGGLLVFIFGTAPFGCLAISALLSYRLIKNYEFSPQNRIVHGLGITAWLLSYVVTWRIAILKTLEVYASLPETPPECYIATAAAKGHPQFVKSESVLITNGQIMSVNAQLRNLKYAELALMAICPRTHIFLRKIYDVVGKALAQKIMHPVLADISYLALKPLEWGAIFVMKVLFPDLDEFVGRIYGE